MFCTYATISLVQTISMLKGFVMIFVISFWQQIWWRLSLENLTLYKIGVRQRKRMENSCSYVFRSIFFLYYELLFLFLFIFLLLKRYATWMESINFSSCNLKTYINHLVKNTFCGLNYFLNFCSQTENIVSFKNDILKNTRRHRAC